jgi:selenium metabolism protein YedF
MIIDARGFGCPKPVVMAEEALSKIDEGLIEVLVDNEASANNISRFATRQGLYLEIIKEDNHWKIKILKGYPCKVKSAGTPERAHEAHPVELAETVEKLSEGEYKKGFMLIIGSDTMGKEEELGKILMKVTLETMLATKDLPDTIFFLNAGVKLTTLNDEIVQILKQMEKHGIEIFSCGTCLKYYKLESELKVGFRGASGNLIEGIMDSKKVVWI